MIVKKDCEYLIELNENYDIQKANGFLMADGSCVGGFDRRSNGTWTADITKVYDAENDSDCYVIGTFDSQEKAIEALWEHRFNAVK